MNDESKIDLTAARKLADEAKERAEKATPGPWYWDINRHHYAVRLMTPKNGQCVVMDFVRWGMQRAQPRFSNRPRADLGGVMRTIEEIDKTEPGLSAYPDAVFITNSRTDVPALADLVTRLADALEQAQAWQKKSDGEWVKLSEQQQAMIADYDTRRRAAETEVERLRAAIVNWEANRTHSQWPEPDCPACEAERQLSRALHLEGGD